MRKNSITDDHDEKWCSRRGTTCIRNLRVRLLCCRTDVRDASTSPGAGGPTLSAAPLPRTDAPEPKRGRRRAACDCGETASRGREFAQGAYVGARKRSRCEVC